jgi:hypothetical protein
VNHSRQRETANDRTLDNSESGLFSDKILKTSSLLQVLCKTYKKDPIFGNSMLNLLEKLEQDAQELICKAAKSAQKKKHYKKVARNFKTDFKQMFQEEQTAYEMRLQEQQALIESQQ